MTSALVSHFRLVLVAGPLLSFSLDSDEASRRDRRSKGLGEMSETKGIGDDPNDEDDECIVRDDEGDPSDTEG